MDFETLEQRTHLAGSGVDTTFGTDGVVNLNAFSGQSSATLSVGGAYYVGTQYGVVRYDTDGKLDITWAGDGYASTDFPVTQLAYDPWTASVYAAGSTYEEEQGDFGAVTLTQSLRVARFTPAGDADSTFGTGGVFRYDVQTIQDSKVAAIPVQLLPLAHRRLAVAVDRATVSSYTSYLAQQREVGDVAMMVLRSDGTRDASFGIRGVSSVLGRSSTTVVQEYGESQTVRGAFFESLRANTDGSFGMTLVYRTGSRYLDYVGTDPIDRHPLVFAGLATQIKHRRIFSSGGIDTTAAHSWTIIIDSKAASRGLLPLTSQDDGQGNLVLVTKELDRGKSIAKRYTLSPSTGVRAATLSTPGLIVDAAVMTRNGLLYVGEVDGSVARFRLDDLTLDRRFGESGFARTASPFLHDLAATEDGDVLALGSGTLTRLI